MYCKGFWGLHLGLWYATMSRMSKPTKKTGRVKKTKKTTEEPAMPPSGAAAVQEQEQDRHKSKKMFRLPEEWHAAYKALATRNHRPMTWEIKIALGKHLTENGIESPE